MNFKEGLQRIANQIDDFIGIALVDSDGILVEEYKKDDLFDLTPLVAEYSAFLKVADKASISSDVGPSHEMTVLAEKATIIINKMAGGYFLCLVTQSPKNVGKGRFYMKREAALIAADL